MSEFSSREEKEEFTDHLFDTLREGLLVLNNGFMVKNANSSFCNMFQVDPTEVEGRKLFNLGNNQWDIPDLRNLLEKLLPEEKEIKDYEIEHTFPEIGDRVMLLNARQIDDAQLILLVFGDITERKQAMQEIKETKENLEEKVEERTEKVRDLASRITEVEQKERSRIAEILHDELQQYLIALQMNLKNIQQQIESKNLSNQLLDKTSESIELINQSIDKTKKLSSDLDPPVLEARQITEIFEWLVKRFDEMHNFNIDLQIKVKFKIQEKELRAIILKIVRELLFNIVKHAGTDQAVIKTDEADKQIVIHVIDKGSGFNLNSVDHKEHFGLVSIRERLKIIDGKLEIDTAPGRGTHIRVMIPEKANIAPE